MQQQLINDQVTKQNTDDSEKPNQRIWFTFSCDDVQADSCGIGSFGITKKCVGACLFISWNATH